MCEYCENIKKISFSTELTDKEKEELIAEETNKEIMMDFLEANPDLITTYEELGLTAEDFEKAERYEITDEDLKEEFAKKKGSKITNLFKYESFVYSSKGYGKNSRRFCKELATRMQLGAMTYQQILRLNGSNPGFGSGGSNSYSVYLYRGGKNCKHFWTKYYLDLEKGSLTKSPTNEQPFQINKGSV